MAAALLTAAPFAGCSPSAAQLGAQADRRDGTQVFSWLLGDQPSAVVVLGAPVSLASRLLPQSRVIAATAHPCEQTRRSHALLVVVGPAAQGASRDLLLDCGVALYRDRGALVEAPR
ncbi:MAG: hypothetical protein ACREM2_00130 [Vulcanimicrobiaceae bacterium]